MEREWEVIGEEEGLQTVRNKETDREGQVHKLCMDPRRNLEKELEVYNYRRTQQNALVAVYAVHSLGDSQRQLCGNEQTYKVVTERIPRRLSDLPVVPQREALYLLSEALRGYDDLYSKVGEFEVTDRMVGLNPQGQVRVWLNENFADNHPPTERPMLQVTAANTYKLTSEKEEERMLQSVVRLVEQKCEGGQLPEEIKYRLARKSTFVDAYHEIELYCQDRNLEIPDRLSCNSLSTVRSEPIIQSFDNYMRGSQEHLSDRPPTFQPSLNATSSFQPLNTGSTFQPLNSLHNGTNSFQSPFDPPNNQSTSTYQPQIYEPRQTLINNLSQFTALSPNRASLAQPDYRNSLPIQPMQSPLMQSPVMQPASGVKSPVVLQSGGPVQSTHWGVVQSPVGVHSTVTVSSPRMSQGVRINFTNGGNYNYRRI